MASRGEYVEGTDGSDYAHRQRVANHYVDISYYKKKLQSLVWVQIGFLLLMVAAAVYWLQTQGALPYHRPMLVLPFFLPVLLLRDSKNESQMLMVVYSGGAGLYASYLLWIGVGRTMDSMGRAAATSQDQARSMAFAAFNLFGALLHLAVVYYTRRLIGLYDSILQARGRRKAE
eukprot:m.50503 g.50503  ORF g.50503 m.50503 type:complete len:174 (-) comp15145_c0_seq1:53-574(-)